MTRLILILSLLGASPVLADNAVAEGPGVWRLVSLNDVAPQGPVTLTLAEPGRIAGQGPCNRYSGAVSIDGTDFAAGPIAATRMACDRLDEEQAYFAALAAVTTLDQSGPQLVLTGPDLRLEFAMPVN